MFNRDNLIANIKAKIVAYQQLGNKSVTIAGAIFAVLTIWMLSGLLKSDKVEKQEELSLSQSVRVFESIATERENFIELNAITSPEQLVNLRSEVDGVVLHIESKKARFLKKGDVIVRIDPRDAIVAFEAAQAELDTQKINYDSAQAIFKKKLSSQSALADAKAKLLNAEKELEKARYNLEDFTIKAPFDGFINNIAIDVGDYLSMAGNNVIGTFASLDPILIDVYIPERDIQKVLDSKKAEVIFSDRAVDGHIRSVSRVSNDENRTFKLEVVIDNKKYEMLAGNSVRIKIFTGKVLAHEVPKSVLDLDDKGDLIIKIVEDSVVKSYPVALEDEDAKSFWVTGLPDSAKIILIGQQYVKDGEEVDWDQKL